MNLLLFKVVCVCFFLGSHRHRVCGGGSSTKSCKMGSLGQRDCHWGLGRTGAGLRCRGGKMSSCITTKRWLFLHTGMSGALVTLLETWFWDVEPPILFAVTLFCFCLMAVGRALLCLSAANLRAQGRRVDALCQDAGGDQREPRWSRGIGQRLILHTPHRQPRIYLSPVHYTPKAHYTTQHLASSFFHLVQMNWPEEMCRARRDREDSVRQVLDVFLKV